MVEPFDGDPIPLFPPLRTRKRVTPFRLVSISGRSALLLEWRISSRFILSMKHLYHDNET
jgi:hypothetical protein